VVTVAIQKSPSVFFKDMEGSRLPIPVAHGEGRAVFTKGAANKALAPLHYVDNHGKSTQTYPLNPNGAEQAVAGLTTPDGRATILMPHPERVFLTNQNSWHPADWGVNGPWFRMFQNARTWVDQR
jgi:phosphoribosylformylglycinamidine synthase